MLRFNAFPLEEQSSVPDMIKKAVAPLRQTAVMKTNPAQLLPALLLPALLGWCPLLNATLLPAPPVETINILLNPAPGAAASRSKPI